jgi:hypothetical protein
MFSTGNDPNEQLRYCITGASRFYYFRCGVSLDFRHDIYLVFRSDLEDRIMSERPTVMLYYDSQLQFRVY